MLKRAAALKLRCVGIVPRHLSLLELEPGDCRYPYGGEAEGEAITFCGHPRREGSSYCVSHFHLTSSPGTASERIAGKVPLRLGGGGMSTKVAVMAARMKRLSPRHRLAHLRALIRREPAGSNRWLTLIALLRDQWATTLANENRSL